MGKRSTEGARDEERERTAENKERKRCLILVTLAEIHQWNH